MFITVEKHELLTVEVVGADNHGGFGFLEEQGKPVSFKPLVFIKNGHFVGVIVNTVAFVGVSDGDVKSQCVTELIGSCCEVELGESSTAHIELQLVWTVYKP